MSPCKAPTGVFDNTMVVSVVWSADACPMKNRVMSVALALSGQNLKGRPSNRPSVGISGERESGEVVHGSEARGETLSHHLERQIELHKNNENNIHGGVKQPPIGKSTYDKQPKTSGRDKGEHRGICNERDAWGACDRIILVTIRCKLNG
jgi:hypothetical protein